MEDTNYIPTHQKLLLQPTDNKADKERKCLIHFFTTSTQILNNQSSMQLLKTKLNRLRKNNLDNEAYLSSCPQPKYEWTNNNLVNVKSILQPYVCSQTSLNCTELNNLTDEYCENVCHTYMQKSQPNYIANKRPNSSTLQEPLQQSENTPYFKSLPSRFPTKLLAPQKSIENTNFSSKEVVNLGFKTAFQELQEQNLKKFSSDNGAQNYGNNVAGGGQKKRLGMRGRARGKFISPLLSTSKSNEELLPRTDSSDSDKLLDERLKNIEPRMVELIQSEIMDCGAPVHWDDIAGLEFAKTAIQEAVVWPLLRPDIFTGLRRPPKGILLFGPPGTGKTLIGKCVASQSKSTFFSISASSLTSKWIGDGEKMVRALFAVARCHQPAVIFIDEIDSLLSQRSETEHESSRRIKTEFLVQLDGATTDSDERLLVIGATNRPQELDEAARRRFVKRLYIPLPEFEGRLQLVTRLMQSENKNLTDENLRDISRLSDGYSGADMKNLCSEASLGPIRSIDMSKIQSIQLRDVTPVDMGHFTQALSRVKASVSPKDLEQYTIWNNTYGAGV